MRVKIILFLLFICSLSNAESIYFEVDESASQGINYIENISLEPTKEYTKSYEIPVLVDSDYRSPATKEKMSEISTSEEVSKYSRLYLIYNLRKGKVYFPQVSVDAEFNSIEFIKSNKISKSSFFYNLGLDYMFNGSKAKFYSILSSIGYEFSITDKLVINPSVGLALTYYKEQSNIQNVNSLGNNIFIKTGVDYLVSEKCGINLNLQWNHEMHSQGYYPKENTNEMVLEYLTTGIGIVWKLE